MTAPEQSAYSPLQWLGPELVRGGFVRNESWVPAHCDRALKVFPNQGMHIAASLMASLHPRAIEYIEQAPVLVMAASEGGKVRRIRERQYLAQRFGSLCHRGPKLRDMLGEFGASLPMRSLCGFALTPDRWMVVKHLRKVPPSLLAQSIPERPGEQASWLRSCLQFSRRMTARRGADGWHLFDWAVLAISRAGNIIDAGDVADFASQLGVNFDRKWTWAQAAAAAERWHDELARMDNEKRFYSQHGIGFSDAIDYGRLPSEAVVSDLEIVALRSGEALYAEGRAMHHCVASYTREVLTGQSRIYSVRRGGDRIATFELSPLTQNRWRLSQLKGPCNRAVPSNVQQAVSKFIGSVNEARA